MATAALACAGAWASPVAWAQKTSTTEGVTVRTAADPAVIKALGGMGVTVVGRMLSPGGLQAWAGYSGDTPVALYLTPDGRHVIAGTLLDTAGLDVNRSALEAAVAEPLAGGLWAQVQASHWIADGRDSAPRKVYVFTDMNCPYCNKLWADARPWVDSGRVQLRHILVGVIKPDSAAKAATVLAAPNAAAVLAEHSRLHVSGNAQALKSGRARPLGDAGVAPAKTIAPAIEAKLSTHHALMAALGLHATPSMVWMDEQGVMRKQRGAPEQVLPQVLGPLK